MPDFLNHESMGYTVLSDEPFFRRSVTTTISCNQKCPVDIFDAEKSQNPEEALAPEETRGVH